jgi:hypothetical protein
MNFTVRDISTLRRKPNTDGIGNCLQKPGHPSNQLNKPDALLAHSSPREFLKLIIRNLLD